jgi:hypothetical protein
LKLVAEYMRDVILFEQMASRETDAERKEALEKQAKAFRNLASLLWNRHRYSEVLVCFYARPRKICGLTPAD